MSYEPLLLIKIEDLNKHENLFNSIENNCDFSDEYTRGGEEGKTLLETLRDLYFEDEKWIVDVFGMRCRYITPRYSSYNREFRKFLDEIGISYVCIGG